MFPQAVTLQHNRQFSRRWPTAQIGFNNPRRRHNASTCKNSPANSIRQSLRKSEIVRKSGVLLAASTRVRSRRVPDWASDLAGTAGGLFLT